ncbi:redoxin domain-containing protein [Candidatus Poribacteria bacterium]|nr:redoxin domain-containing protein [Candidatus Poribacteria bacterium]
MEQLGELQEALPRIAGEGANLIAIAVDSPSQNKKVMADHKLAYPVLSDPKRKAVVAYGVLDPESNPFTNPGSHANIARPATFVIDGGGVIRWKHVGTSTSDRPSVATIISQLRSVAGI